MREQEYIDKFDRVLRYYMRPLLVKLIHKVSDASLPEYDLVNEYCEDNNLQYVGTKPRRREGDLAILRNLSLGPDWTKEKIQEIANLSEVSDERKSLVTIITKGMDVQAAMRLMVYRWMDIKTMGYPNIQNFASVLGVESKRLESIRVALDMLIFARNKSGAHYTDYSDISKKEYDRKMQHVGIVFRELSFLDASLFEEFEELYAQKETGKEPVVDTSQKKKRILVVAIVSVIVMLGIGAKIFYDSNVLKNSTNFVWEEEFVVAENGKMQMYPCEIYCQNNQLVIELWVGNGTERARRNVDIDFTLKNSAGKKIVQVKDYQYDFEEKLESGESTYITLRFNARDVKNKESDLTTILWGYGDEVKEMRSGMKNR